MADRSVTVVLRASISDYQAKLGVASKATTDFERKVSTSTGRASQGYHMLGVGMLAAGGVVAAGFATAAKAALDFDSKMALVRTLAHATPADMAQLRAAALSVGQAYGYSAGQVADAEAELVKAGISTADIMGGALAGALTLAAAGQADVADATTIAATAMTQFGLTGKDVPHIADLLAAGADKALGGVTDLGYALDQAGPQAHQFGVSLEETVGTLAAFAQSGQIGERGGTVFSQMLLKLSAPGKQASGILKQLGIDVYDTNGQFIGMAGLAGKLQKGLGGLTQAERTHDLSVLFGARAIRGANILYQEGAKGIEDWTNKVNDAGFAQLQAAGKLDSLSGDLTKLGTALNTALIGAGEGSQGPLRAIVQDITKLVEAWDGLPGPVRDAILALAAAGGAVTLAGGAALLFIPKWAAMNAALKDTSVGAVSATGALKGITKATVAVGVIVGIGEAAHALGQSLMHDSVPSVDAMTTALLNLDTHGGDATNSILGYVNAIGQTHNQFGVGAKMLTSLDAALAGLVTSGHADAASADFTQISATLKAAGWSTAQITAAFPGLSSALASASAQAEATGTGIDDAGNAMSTAAKKTQNATDAIKAYSAALHALNDPLFAMNQALQDLKTKQDAADKATRKYGAGSHQAKQANLELASSALGVEAAAEGLAKQVQAGTIKLSDAKGELRAWTKDGLLTKRQADDVAKSFGGLITKAHDISGIKLHLKVSADTSAANRDLDIIREKILTLPDHTVHITTTTRGGSTTTTGAQLAAGGAVRGPGTGTSDSIPAWLSNGEFVMPADVTAKHLPLLEMMRAKRFAAGGRVGTPNLSVLGLLGHVRGGHSEQSLQGAVDAIAALSAAWQETLQQMSDAAQHHELLAALHKAHNEKGKQAAGDVQAAQKALHDFHEQQRQARISRKLDAAATREQAKEALQANKEAYQYDRMTQGQQLRYLAKRMAGEKKYSDAWIADAQKRGQILADEGKSEAANTAARQQAIRDRTATLADTIDPTQKTTTGFAPPIGQLIANGQAGDQQFVDWLKQLGVAKNKGLSHAAIVMLGLDSGPSELAELLQINAGTPAEIAELNTIARRRRQLAKQGAKATVYDTGGVWPSGTLGVNLSGHDELVIPHPASAGAWQMTPDINVQVFIGNEPVDSRVKQAIGRNARDSGYQDRRKVKS